MNVVVGYSVAVERVLTQADFDRFAALSGDDNPIHVDAAFAARTRFGRTVSHGMLLYSLICGLLSQRFPGAAQLWQNLIFPAPTFAGEPIIIRAEVTELIPPQQLRLAATITRADGELTCEGETILAMR